MIYVLGDKRVETASADWYVAPSADVIGSVRLGHETSVWFQCVLRGDSDWIEIGDGTNVQDGTIIHTDQGSPTRVGAGVTIGHRAFLHSCTVGDESMIANGAMVLDRVTIGRNCVIAAGALIPPDKTIPDGSVVMGAPGRIVRETSAQDLQMIARAGAIYRQRAKEYVAALGRDSRAIDAQR
ncbi:MAG TPA: gamma carbonic anhydrase family protein [Steroidobacteraceae bacterium]|nr:gamma carbonic anhydrase family protein [Steroidobacteraceae bacterium]HRX89255.1 gamma carbonic anhydrase family protein [Steroidobacteraceae bacterium]